MKRQQEMQHVFQPTGSRSLTTVKFKQTHTTTDDDGTTRTMSQERITEARDQLDQVILARNRQPFAQSHKEKTPFTTEPLSRTGWKNKCKQGNTIKPPEDAFTETKLC